MRWLLVIGLSWFLLLATACCVLALIVRSRVQRHHRVDPSVATEAPLTWTADPRAAARLHRRLARVGTTLGQVMADHAPRGRRQRAEPPPLHAAAAELRRQAVTLDHQLTRLATLAPSARRVPLARLAEHVAEIETSSAQLVTLSAEVRAPRTLDADDPTITGITQQVDRLAHAHRELLALDEAAGLSPEGPSTRPAGAARTGTRSHR